jgi:hypothetical protein
LAEKRTQTDNPANEEMSKETRFLLWGVFAGLVLGLFVAFAIQRRQRSLSATADAIATKHTSGTRITGSLPVPRPSVQLHDTNLTDVIASTGSSTDGVTAIGITPSCSITFSAPFVAAMRELKASGESPDLLVNLVGAEFNRQRRDLVNAVHQKLDRGELDFEESQEFFHSRNEPLGKAIAEILGEDGFRYWDKQRLLRSVATSGYTLTTAESDELYRIEKEHEQRNAKLTKARDDGELDPLDYEAQRGKSDEQYQQERAKIVKEGRGRGENEAVNIVPALKSQTKELNLTPQQLADMVESVRRISQATERLDMQDASYADKQRALEAEAERDLIRILGPQGYADFKKVNDHRYQTMKQYQEVWRLSDTDVNYLYETFAKHDKAIEDHNAHSPPIPEGEQAGKETSGTEIDEFARAQKLQLETDLLQFLGEERFRRFKAAGLVSQD